MDYGYAKVSTKEQNEQRQIVALEEFGLSRQQIFVDKQSGRDFERANYRKLIRRLKEGDTLIVKSIDRLGRNYNEILEQWRIITKEKGAAIVVLDMPLLDTRRKRDLTGTLIADIVLQLLSYVAQTEREFIHQRQAEGIAAAKARGVRFGRPRLEKPENFPAVRLAWQRADSIKLPKVGVISAKVHRKVPDGAKLKSVTVSQDRDDRYYASILYEVEKEPAAPAQISEDISHIGLDYKSDGLYVDSFGNSADMPHFYRESHKKLAKAQRKLSKKEKGSKNREKQRRKVAKIAAHIANQRKDFLHKLSAEITNQYELVSVESLNMKSLSQSLHLGKATLDNGYGMFCEMLRYKQLRKGHYFVKVDRLFPSSQLCQCGYKNPATKDLSVRTVECPVCGSIYDRDINAAKNIDKEGLRILLAA